MLCNDPVKKLIITYKWILMVLPPQSNDIPRGGEGCSSKLFLSDIFDRSHLICALLKTRIRKIEKDVALIKIRRITLQTHKPRFEKSNRNKIEKGNLKQNAKETSFAISKLTEE